MTALLRGMGSFKTLLVNLATPRENLMNQGAWRASHAYNLNDIIYPTVGNGYAYKCTTAGTTGSTQPTWPTTVGSTVTDGTVTWTAQTNTFTLPTTNPGSASAQISFTVASSDFPTFTGVQPSSYFVSPTLYLTGFNGNTVSATVSFAVYRNGVQLGTNTTSSSVSTSNYFGIIAGVLAYNNTVLAVGDVITIALWASTTNVTFDYWCFQIYPSRMVIGSPNDINYNVTYTLTTANTKVAATYTPGFLFYPNTLSTNMNFNLGSGSYNFNAFSWNKTYASGRINYGDSSVSGCYTTASTATANRAMCSNVYPQKLTFRKVYLG